MLMLEYAAVTQKNAELRKEVRELMEKIKLVEQGKDQAQKQVLALGKQQKAYDQEKKKKQQKAGPFGTIKDSRTTSTVVPDESVNPRLTKILEKVAVNRELMVAPANSYVRKCWRFGSPT